MEHCRAECGDGTCETRSQVLGSLNSGGRCSTQVSAVRCEGLANSEGVRQSHMSRRVAPLIR